ncbi:MAG TPA: TetR/AcrR family transcriptional regulator, partial [Acidimicrobiia bacterium]|nr:TetR/AcrR family transcriptional regulator [Acidimicrobiia bacterium]
MPQAESRLRCHSKGRVPIARSRYPNHAELFDLLWRGDDRASARTGLSVSRIVEEAVRLADQLGMNAVTMRQLAERLGVAAMSLYRYVPGREELVALMVERVYGELATQSSEAADWKESLRSIAHEYWELYERHPWLLEVPITRPVVGPNRMDRQEHELGAVDGVGLDELEMDAAVELVVNQVASAAKRLHGIRRDAEASGMSDDEWWHDVLPVLNRVLAGRYYPVSERVGEAIGAAHLDTGFLFEFG